MPNPYFSFKQFTVHHDRCAMKVGTDGVLLGAWTNIVSAARILDIGTGTGLISLMLAQRCRAQITAVDIDREAVEQARGNVMESPWADRIKVEWQDICRYTPEIRFDTIVSNPPYFVNSMKCPDDQRNKARHTDELDFENLIACVADLLSPDGAFSVIIPADGMSDFLTISEKNGLFLSRRTYVRTKPEAEPKRVLLEFKTQSVIAEEDCLVVELSRHVYSKEYTALTKEFYLKM